MVSQRIPLFVCDFDGLYNFTDFTKCGDITIESKGTPLYDGKINVQNYLIQLIYFTKTKTKVEITHNYQQVDP